MANQIWSHSFLKSYWVLLSACATSVWRQELPWPGGHGNSSLGLELIELRELRRQKKAEDISTEISGAWRRSNSRSRCVGGIWCAPNAKKHMKHTAHRNMEQKLSNPTKLGVRKCLDVIQCLYVRDEFYDASGESLQLVLCISLAVMWKSWVFQTLWGAKEQGQREDLWRTLQQEETAASGRLQLEDLEYLSLCYAFHIFQPCFLDSGSPFFFVYLVCPFGMDQGELPPLSNRSHQD